MSEPEGDEIFVRVAIYEHNCGDGRSYVANALMDGQKPSKANEGRIMKMYKSVPLSRVDDFSAAADDHGSGEWDGLKEKLDQMLENSQE